MRGEEEEQEGSGDRVCPRYGKKLATETVETLCVQEEF